MDRKIWRFDNASMAKRPQIRKPPQGVRHYVKQWREHRGLTQEQLAERVGKSRGLISRIESGTTALTEDMMYALADAFHIAPWDIIRVNPEKEGTLVDITDALQGKPADLQAEALGFVRGLLRKH